MSRRKTSTRIASHELLFIFLAIWFHAIVKRLKSVKWKMILSALVRYLSLNMNELRKTFFRRPGLVLSSPDKGYNAASDDNKKQDLLKKCQP